jgi:hypothetical protein
MVSANFCYHVADLDARVSQFPRLLFMLYNLEQRDPLSWTLQVIE